MVLAFLCLALCASVALVLDFSRTPGSGVALEAAPEVVFLVRIIVVAALLSAYLVFSMIRKALESSASLSALIMGVVTIGLNILDSFWYLLDQYFLGWD